MNLTERLASVTERRRVARDVLIPLQIGVRDRTVAKMYNRLAPGSDGRIHTGLGIATTSGRLASADTIVEEAGTNLQNQANKIVALDPLYNTRDCMLPDVGMQLLCRDYSGAEALCVFAYSRDWEWVDRLLKSEPIHSLHAKEFFGLTCPAGDVKKKHKDVYTTAKNLTFLSFYAGGPSTAATTFNKDYAIHGQRITIKEVERIQHILYQLHPLERWWEEVREEIARTSAVRNCFGQRRRLRDPDEHARLKDALAQLPQSTIAWRMNEAVITVHDTLDRMGEIELLHQVHDEMIVQAAPECVDEALEGTRKAMEVEFTIHGRKLIIPSEAKVGKLGASWGTVKTA